VFEACCDRKTWRVASVAVSRKAAAAWRATHGRDLSSAERYGIAKMALFRALDGCPGPAPPDRIPVDSADVEELAAALGLD
jgi:hypothetical protein